MIRVFVILLALLAASSSHADDLTSLSLAGSTIGAALKLDGTCLNYKVPHRFCIWFSPKIGRNVTPMLDHYLPDLVVIVYRNKDENPWLEARVLLDKLSSTVQEGLVYQVGSGNHAFLDEHEQQVIFKEADVIGNPGLIALLNNHKLNLVLLPSTAIPMNPYFQSMLDSLLWRGLMPQALPEEFAAVALSQLHHVGTMPTDWGGVYPHEGSVIGNNDAKASMVIAQRAADLLTSVNTFDHFHQSLSTQCGERCKAAPIRENDKETLFQPVYPLAKEDCSTLGSDSSYDPKMLNEKGAYVWIVWRHYKGCADGDGKFIGVTP